MNASRIIGPGSNSDDLHYAYEVHTYAHTALMIMVKAKSFPYYSGQTKISRRLPGRSLHKFITFNFQHPIWPLCFDKFCLRSRPLSQDLKDEYFNVAWTEDDQQQGLAVMEKLVRVSFCEKFALDLESHHDF